MDLDATFILLAGVGVLFFGGFCVLVGRLLDPMFRVRQLRRFLRRNYLVLYFVSKDGKTILPRVINADDDTFMHKGALYVVEKGKIWRRMQGEAGSAAVELKEGGFNFNPSEGERPVRYEEGVPVIYMDNEHIKPLQFSNEEAKVTPSGVGSAINAWVSNQIAKGLVGENKFLNIGLLIIGILALCGLFFSYQANDQIGAIKASCTNTQGAGSSVQNGTLIISQPAVKTEGYYECSLPLL
jgi:hypothetical protein